MTVAHFFANVTCELARLMFQGKPPLGHSTLATPGWASPLHSTLQVFPLHNICITIILEATQAITQPWSFPT